MAKPLGIVIGHKPNISHRPKQAMSDVVSTYVPPTEGQLALIKVVRDITAERLEAVLKIMESVPHQRMYRKGPSTKGWDWRGCYEDCPACALFKLKKSWELPP